MGHSSLPQAINSFGLLLDILGVVLLFFFGVPSRAGLDGVLTLNRGSGKDYKWARALSRCGLLLLIAGFLLQIASNHVGARAPNGIYRVRGALDLVGSERKRCEISSL